MGGIEQRGSSDTLFRPNQLVRQLPGLNIATLNVRSINNKSARVTDFIASHNIDIFALQETWHENSESLALRRAVPAGYSIVDAARSAKTNDVMNNNGLLRASGGGVAIIYRAELKMKKINTLPIVKTCEHVCCRFSSANCGDVIVLSLYRPGSKPLTSEFLLEFTTLLEALATFRCPLILLGDLNIHFELSSNAQVSEFIDLLSSFDLKQFVQDASHKAGGILDVIIARNNESVADISVSESGISDHCLVTGRLLIHTNCCDSIPVESRKWNNFSIDGFRDDLLNSVMCADLEWTKSTSVDELFCVYNNTLVSLLDKHAPRYVRKRKRRLMTPWFDDDCRHIKRKGRALERLYRKSHDPSDRLRWVQQLQEQARFYQEKERSYWSNRITTNAANPRQLWNDLNELMKRDDDNHSELSTPLEAVKNY